MVDQKTIAIVGAGPVGLAAAAHVIERGMTPLLFERGLNVADAVLEWSHVPMFSNWEYNIDDAARRLLKGTDWTAPDQASYPTGAELLSGYLLPLARLTPIANALRLSSNVVGITRQSIDKVKDDGRGSMLFELVIDTPTGRERHQADAVIDASGTWSSPNPAGSNGLPAEGEDACHELIGYGMPDVLGSERDRYSQGRTAVIGGGHSAIGSLLALTGVAVEPPVWLHRANDMKRTLGGGSEDQLAARGALGQHVSEKVEDGHIELLRSFRTAAFERSARGATIVAEDGRRVDADRVIVATGFRPELDMLREVRVSLDPALECPPELAPLIDPNIHSCGTVRPHGVAELSHPEPGLFIAGMKSYGRAPTFLMTTGYEQVRSIVASLAGDHAAAARVELHLPETGVCSGPGIPSATDTAGISEACC